MSKKEERWALVAGATGYLGGYVIRALHRDGWKIRALARDDGKLGDLRELCDEVFVGEATKAESIAGLCDGMDAAFSSIGIRHFRRTPTFEEVDYQANLNVVRQAEVAGVQRFVFVSVLGGHELRSTSPLVDARERVVDALALSSMRAVILRPTGFFNDMGDFFEMAERGKVWLLGTGETKINPVHGADLADIAATAMSAVEPEFEIAVGGPRSYSQRQIAELCFQALGKEGRFGTVRPGLVRFIAKLVRPFNGNASALALMFATLGESDAVAPCYGEHQLDEHFQKLAEVSKSSTASGT